MSQRDLVIETIRKLPQEVTIDEIIEEIALLAAIRKGEQDADSGRIVSHEHVRETMAAWRFNFLTRFPELVPRSSSCSLVISFAFERPRSG